MKDGLKVGDWVECVWIEDGRTPCIVGKKYPVVDSDFNDKVCVRMDVDNDRVLYESVIEQDVYTTVLDDARFKKVANKTDK